MLNRTPLSFIFYSVRTKQDKFHSNTDLALQFWTHTWKRLATCTSCLLHIPIQGWFSQRCPACVSLEQCRWPACTCGRPSTAGTFCSLSLLAFHQQVSFPLLAALHSPHTAWYSGQYILLKRYWRNIGGGKKVSFLDVCSFFTGEETSMCIHTFYQQIEHTANYTKVRHKNYLSSHIQMVVEDAYILS